MNPTPPPPPPQVIAAWTRLARAAATLQAEVEAALKAAGLPPLAWYDVLWEIERAGPGGIRPHAVEARLLLPQYGLSRLVDRLVAAGLVARAPCPDDRRGLVLTLTPEGEATRARAWAVYGPALSAAMDRRLSRADTIALARLLAPFAP
jgi:DNA-binding MarR family transcriptional regulator